MSVLLIGDQAGFRGDWRYLVYRWFAAPAARAVHLQAEEDRHARQLVADLRATLGRRSGDAAVIGLVERLQAVSADFRRLWAEHEVAVRRADHKTVIYPLVGEVLMNCETLVTPDQGQELVVFSPANAEARERLELLRVLGVEEFSTGKLTSPASGRAPPSGS